MRSVLASLLVLAFASPAFGSQNRLAAGVSPTQQRVVVRHGVNPRARLGEDLGEAPADALLSSITLRFNLTAQQQAALTQLAADQLNPASSRYHQWLTPEGYAVQFGISQGDLTTLSNWLSGNGLTVTGVARSRSFVTVSGTAGQVARTFGTMPHRVLESGEVHVANLTDPTLPASVAAMVTSITGLDDFHLKPHARVRTVASPRFTSSVSGNTYIAPGDFYTIYDLSPLLNSSINGSGIAIAVLGQTDISLADVAAFRSAAGLPANAPTVKLYGTDPGTRSADIDEAQLDVEWAGATAPSASVLYVNASDVIAGSLTQAIDNNLAPIVTISYGNCESGFGASYVATYNQLLLQANVQGQTTLGPSGDSGATDCDYRVTSATGGLAVDFPASSPYATGVGGTMFNENGGTYFSSTNNGNAGSALSYIPERVWNETSSGSVLSAGGGGVSAFFTKPAWQVGTGVPNDSSRDVPDVSFNAASSHDGYLFCSQGSCTSGFRNASGYLNVVGGTSVSTPAFAGIMALLEQKIQARVGNANPTLYGLFNSSYAGSVFHDITVGNNNSPCTIGSTNCASGGTIGYSATAGYDLASGIGSVDVFQMVSDWLLVTPAGVGSKTGTTPSTTTLTASATTVTAGTTITLNVKVAASSGTQATTPTGTVQLLIDNVLSGATVSLSSGTATLTLATAGLTSGNHQVSVAYLGDATYAGSKGSITVDVISATAADFTLTPLTATVTVASGASAPGVTFTVTPTNGFTGNVAFSAASSTALSATYSFSVTPVVLSGTSAGTTVLSLVASASTGATSGGTILGSAHPPVRPAGMKPWQIAGSGVAFAGMLLIVLPRRRGQRWSALMMLGVLLTGAGSMTLSGCGSGKVPISSLVTKTTPGTYLITVSASGTNAAGTALVHTAQVNFVVQ